jgi:hypothetical protein
VLGEYIDSERAAQLSQRDVRDPNPWLGLGAEGFTAQYNRQPFLIWHRLHEHPLLQRDAVFELCRRHPRSSVLLRAGKVPVTEDFARSFDHFGKGMDLEDALQHFEDRQAYIVINNPERDPAYRAVIEGLLGEIARSTAVIDPDITWYSSYIFISSAQAVTPYHMDREMNFLFQIQGRKQVKLWNPNDDAVMTSAEKDELLAYASELRPPYKPATESKAQHFELRPGIGVHHPFIAPHVVSTESDFSISMALTYRTRRTDTWTDAHRVNHKLRQYGGKPRPVGDAPRLDYSKATLIRNLDRLRDLGRSLRGHR